MAMVPQALTDVFRSAYGNEPAVITSAPGRVNLIGEHLDYNGGEVLPMAIGRRTWTAMRVAERGGLSRAISAQEGERGEFDFSDPRRTGKWWDYISGLGAKTAQLPAVDIAVWSDVPSGAGLSSSAALEVSAAVALASVTSGTMSMRELALDAWTVETQFVGVSCGIMDQFASALASEGNALHVWCDTADTEDVPFNESVLIFDTAQPHSLRNSAFNERQAECAEALGLLRRSSPSLANLASVTPEEVLSSDLPQPLLWRALHVAEEMQRVKLAVAQLKANGTIAADLLYESHASLRDHYQCSSRELNWFVDGAMLADGVKGARLTGAGWGGCAIALGNRDALEAAGEKLAVEYERVFHRAPRTWLSEASAGARVDHDGK